MEKELIRARARRGTPLTAAQRAELAHVPLGLEAVRAFHEPSNLAAVVPVSHTATRGWSAARASFVRATMVPRESCVPVHFYRRCLREGRPFMGS